MRDGRPAGAPAAREVADWQAAERNAVVWLRWLGHQDARPTTAGADGGVDVCGSGVFAQVKWQGNAVGRAALQRLYGARANQPGTLYFFTNAGYSKPASDYAESVGMATFTYSPATGLMTPVSSAARRIFGASVARQRPATARTAQPGNGRGSLGKTGRPQPPAAAPPPVPGSLADQIIRAAAQLGTNQRRGGHDDPVRAEAGPVHQQRPGGHDDKNRHVIDVESTPARPRPIPKLPGSPPEPQPGAGLAVVTGFGAAILMVVVDVKAIDGDTPAWFAVIGVIAFVIGVVGLVRFVAGLHSE